MNDEWSVDRENQISELLADIEYHEIQARDADSVAASHRAEANRLRRQREKLIAQRQ